MVEDAVGIVARMQQELDARVFARQIVRKLIRVLAVPADTEYGYSVYRVAFATDLWAWTAYGPTGREDGQATSEQTAHAVASNAMRRLRSAAVDVVDAEVVEDGTYPLELMGDEFDPEYGTWLRADGRTRGQAQAIIAGEVGCDFTDIRITTEYLRPDATYEVEPGVPQMVVCSREHAQAIKYYRGRLV